MCEWRHLKMLKRAGRGHAADGIMGTWPGELGVVCPACPHPSIWWHEVISLGILIGNVLLTFSCVLDFSTYFFSPLMHAFNSSDALYPVRRRTQVWGQAGQALSRMLCTESTSSRKWIRRRWAPALASLLLIMRTQNSLRGMPQLVQASVSSLIMSLSREVGWETCRKARGRYSLPIHQAFCA